MFAHHFWHAKVIEWQSDMCDPSDSYEHNMEYVSSRQKLLAKKSIDWHSPEAVKRRKRTQDKNKRRKAAKEARYKKRLAKNLEKDKGKNK